MPKLKQDDETPDPFAGLGDDHCRYIIGELDGPWHFCRARRGRRADGTPLPYRYCDEHFRLCTARTYKARQPSTRVQAQLSRADAVGLLGQEAA